MRPTASFDMKISVDGLFFIGNQLVALSYTGKVAVWQSMTQHWQVYMLYVTGVNPRGGGALSPLGYPPFPQPDLCLKL